MNRWVSMWVVKKDTPQEIENFPSFFLHNGRAWAPTGYCRRRFWISGGEPTESGMRLNSRIGHQSPLGILYFGRGIQESLCRYTVTNSEHVSMLHSCSCSSRNNTNAIILSPVSSHIRLRLLPGWLYLKYIICNCCYIFKFVPSPL